MKVFCIDPFLLAYPRLKENNNKFFQEEFENYWNYFESLIAWGEFIDINRDEEIYLSCITADVLAEVNGYPEWDELEKIIVHLKLDTTIQPHDINIIINSILNLPSIEDLINIKEILFDYEKVECNYSDDLLRRGQIFQESFYRIAILECLLEKIQDKTFHKLLVTRNGINDILDVSLKTEILDYELINESEIIDLDKPYLVEDNFILCTNPEYLYNSVDMWKNSNSEKIDYEIIKKYANEINSKLEKPKLVLSWSFGKFFLETVKNLGFRNEDNKIKILLRSCAETIIEENLKSTHHLRKGKSGNAPQKERKNDKAKAWRRDIDYEYHLHYWKTIDNKIEFVSVVTHDDMTISE